MWIPAKNANRRNDHVTTADTLLQGSQSLEGFRCRTSVCQGEMSALYQTMTSAVRTSSSTVFVPHPLFMSSKQPPVLTLLHASHSSTICCLVCRNGMNFQGPIRTLECRQQCSIPTDKTGWDLQQMGALHCLAHFSLLLPLTKRSLDVTSSLSSGLFERIELCRCPRKMPNSTIS